MPRSASTVAFAGALACALVTSFDGVARADTPRTLPYDARIDLSIAGIGALWYATAEVIKSDLVPEKCRWCYRDGSGKSTLNGIDGAARGALIWQNTALADTASYVVAIGSPVATFGMMAIASANASALGNFPVDALIISEATVIAMDINQTVKYAFARQRPFAHFLAPSKDPLVKINPGNPQDNNLSFFSGHTTFAFSFAVASGTVASMRGYRLAPLVWAVGLPIAATVGYLRIAADRHYLSDVLTGMLVGSAIGFGVPYLFHAGRSSASTGTSAQALAPPTPPTLSFGGAF